MNLGEKWWLPITGIMWTTVTSAVSIKKHMAIAAHKKICQEAVAVDLLPLHLVSFAEKVPIGSYPTLPTNFPIHSFKSSFYLFALLIPSFC